MQAKQSRGAVLRSGTAGLFLLMVLVFGVTRAWTADVNGTENQPAAVMAPLRIETLGPHTQPVELQRYQHVRYVSPATVKWAKRTGEPGAPWSSINEALERITDAGPDNRYALIIAGSVYPINKLAMKPHIDLYGGFEPSGWARDIEKHPSILDGGQKGPLLLGADDARLDGFVVRQGRSAESGGALLCRDTSPWISNNIFSANTVMGSAAAGGAIACIGQRAHPIIEQNIIDFNTTSEGDGGAVAVLDGASARLILNVLAGNLAGLGRGPLQACHGGAVACRDGALDMDGNLLINNMASGGGVGGAVYVGGAGRARIQRNILAGNNAADAGGGLAAIAVGDLLLSANVLADNTTQGPGGGAWLAGGCSGKMENMLICGNRASTGGGLALDGVTMTLAANTICTNRAEQGGGLSVTRGGHGSQHVELTGSIVYFNQALPEIHLESGAALKVSASDLSEPWQGADIMGPDPLLADDSYHGAVATMEFDPQRFQTRLMVVGRQRFDPTELRGRVIRVGLKSSVIIGNRSRPERDQQEIWVWGDMTGGGINLPPTTFQIQPTFRPLPDSPCVDAWGAGQLEMDLFGAPRNDREGKRRLADLGALEAYPREEINPAISAYALR